MTATLLLSFVLFAFVASITPGPNNLMLLHSGVHFGFRASVPHMLGISFGFALMVAMIGFGLGAAFTRWPLLDTLLRWLGAGYFVWLAWRLASAPAQPPKLAELGTARPMSSLGAAAFQWVNPKAWIMAIGAVTTFVPAQDHFFNVLLISALFCLVNLPSVGCWAWAGERLRVWLETPSRMRAFNLAMAALLLASLWPVLAA